MSAARGLAVITLLLTSMGCGDDPPAARDQSTAPTTDAAVAPPVRLDAMAPIVPPDAAPPPSPFIVSEGELANNEAVATALKRQGLTSRDVADIVNALEGIYDFRRARPGAKYSVTRRREDDTLLRFTFEHGPLEIFEVARGEDGALKGSAVEVETRTEMVTRAATIDSSLYAAMQDAGEGPGLVAAVVDVFAWDVDFFKQTRKGDTFRVVAEKVFVGDEFIRYGRILAAEYDGKVASSRMYWFAPKGQEARGEYYLEDGRSAQKSFLATPLKFTRVSSSFGKRRHPVLGYTRKHNGVDYAAPTGTPVWAMAAGKVTWAGRKGPSGILIRIDHQNGLQSAYAHLSRIAKGVKRGAYVRQKQVIGYVGTTGRSTGPHLHFGVKRSGKWINPTSLKMTRGRPIARKHRGAFKAMIAERQKQLEAIPMEPPPAAAVEATAVDADAGAPADAEAATAPAAPTGDAGTP